LRPRSIDAIAKAYQACVAEIFQRLSLWIAAVARSMGAYS
jgi:hypothetical protein